MDSTIRIMLADANVFLRDGLRLLINTTTDFELVAEVSTAVDAINFAKRHKPDVVLMELNLPPSDGFKATRQILADNPNCKVAILTDSVNNEDVFKALQAGASGYLIKSISADELNRSISLIATGSAVFDRKITDQVNDLFHRANTTYRPHHFSELTHRENEVLSFVAKGMKNKQIATQCNITEKTVRNHITNILSKLGANSRGEAISRLQQNSLTISA